MTDSPEDEKVLSMMAALYEGAFSAGARSVVPPTEESPEHYIIGVWTAVEEFSPTVMQMFDALSTAVLVKPELPNAIIVKTVPNDNAVKQVAFYVEKPMPSWIIQIPMEEVPYDEDPEQPSDTDVLEAPESEVGDNEETEDPST